MSPQQRWTIRNDVQKNPECGGRNFEEIYGNHARHVIFQEHPPRLGWWCSTAGGHQAGKRSFGYLDSQLEQLAMNSGCTPERVGVRHLKNKVTDLRADRRPAETFTSGLELPKQLETISMPANDRFGFDDDQWLLPVAPETTKHNPEKTVFCSNSWLFLMTIPEPDWNPYQVFNVYSKSVSATSSSCMQPLQACVEMSTISVRTEYSRTTGANCHHRLS